MEQKKTELMILKKQQEYIQDMEQYIAVLERENFQQKQMIEMLEEQNRVLQKNYNEYVSMVHRMTGAK